MSADDLRVGLVGFGAAGSVFHGPLIAATAGLRLDSIVTADPDRSARARVDHPGATVVADADALFARRPDVVVIATPNRSHVPLAERAIDAGLAVVVDKPMAPSVAASAALVERAAARGVVLTVFHNRRWDGDFLTVAELLAAGRLGTVARFESRFERWRPARKEGWREQPDADEAGGVLFDLGPHLIDQALQLFGPATSVYGEVDCRRAGAAVDDDSFVAVTHASGVRSHLWMSAATAQLGPRFRVLGDAGALTTFGLDGQEAALRAGWRPGGPGGTAGLGGLHDEGRSATVGVDGATEAVALRPGDYLAFYRGVVTAVRDGGPPPVDPSDAIAGLAIIEAARRSAASGSAVAV